MGGGGGGGGSTKKYIRARENYMNKKWCTPINPKNYSCYGLKKFIQGIWWRKKIPAARKFPSPPLTFLVVRPLLCVLPSLHLNTSKSFLDMKQGKEFLWILQCMYWPKNKMSRHCQSKWLLVWHSRNQLLWALVYRAFSLPKFQE